MGIDRFNAVPGSRTGANGPIPTIKKTCTSSPYTQFNSVGNAIGLRLWLRGPYGAGYFNCSEEWCLAPPARSARALAVDVESALLIHSLSRGDYRYRKPQKGKEKGSFDTDIGYLIKISDTDSVV